MKLNLTENARKLLEARYQMKDGNGNVIETAEAVFERIANSVATFRNSTDPNDFDCSIEYWQQQFLKQLTSLKFLPNSPTIMNAGTENPMLSACFVVPVEDSIDEIMDTVAVTARIHKMGGGTGFDFSRLRPKNDIVMSTKGTSSGPVSFMHVFDATTNVIKQGGKRRGANMASLRIDHPDILEFISCKEQEGVLANMNISVAITDEFMNTVEKALEEGVKGEALTYSLKNPRTGESVGSLSALEVFNKLNHHAWSNGEPGVFFIDRINKFHNDKIGLIEGTNPCTSGDTLVAVADGRQAVSFKQLAEEQKDVPVYTADDKGKVCIRMMRNPRITGYNQKVLRVILDDGNSFKVTENHKFVLSDGSVKEAKDLKNGDSLSIMTKRFTTHGNLYKQECDDESNSYIFCNTTFDKTWNRDHRLIYDFFYPNEITNMVVHHKDKNTFNNSIDNLVCMTASEHNSLHISGDNNPMRTHPDSNWMLSPEKQQEIREKYHIGAKRSIETKKKIGSTTKDRFDNDPEFRKRHSEAVKEAMVDNENFEAHIQLRSEKNLQDCQSKTSLPCVLVGNRVHVIKKCEACGKDFSIKWNKREISYCSRSCGNTSSKGIQSRTKGVNATYESKGKQNRDNQVNIFLELKVQLGKIPEKKEWEAKCKKRDIPFRLGTKYGFKTYKELKEYASEHNHRVISVKDAGCEDVYNGTVDEHHKLFIGHFYSGSSGDFRYTYVQCENCGEQPLRPFESCNLGSINLSKFVSDNDIMWSELEHTVKIAVRFLDNIIDLNKFPDYRIKKQTLETRKIGLGVMGFADMLIRLGVVYGSSDSIKIAKDVMKFITEKAHEYSERMGHQFGVYPAWQPPHDDSNPLPNRRNLTCTTIAPTGSLSILAGCSSGIEPNFDYVMKKHVFDTTIYEVNQVVREQLEKKEIYDEKTLERIASGDYSMLDNPELFVKSSEVSVESHVLVQAAFQEYTDNAVSKTINFPYEATIEDVKEAILLAYKSGCKGLTIYRDGSRSVQVLESAKEKKSNPEHDDGVKGISVEALKQTPVKGTRYTSQSGCGTVRVSIFDNPVTGKPFEVFIGMGKSGGCASAFMEVVGRLISTALQEGVSIEKLIPQLTGISCTQHSWGQGGMVLSCLDGVGRILKEAFMQSMTKNIELEHNVKELSHYGQCPDCGAPVVKKEGCTCCSSCFWSQCS